MGPEGREGLAAVEAGWVAGAGDGDGVEEGVEAAGSGCDGVTAGFCLQLADRTAPRNSRQQMTLRFSIKTLFPFGESMGRTLSAV